MDAQGQIKSLYKEAALYQNQGLYEQSKEKHLKILEILSAGNGNSKYARLIDTIKQKINAVDEALKEIENEPQIPILPEGTQTLIKQLFSHSENKDEAAIEGAIALAIFGQYERALAEFQILLDNGILPMAAAKNMLRCHLNLAEPEAAVTQFKQWLSDDAFSTKDLLGLRDYLEKALERKRYDGDLPTLGPLIESDPVNEANAELDPMSDTDTEILAIRITFDHGKLKDEWQDFDTAFQYENTITFEISDEDPVLAEYFEPGKRFNNIQCYCPFSLFMAGGIVTKKQRIADGPRKGHYAIIFELAIP